MNLVILFVQKLSSGECLLNLCGRDPAGAGGRFGGSENPLVRSTLRSGNIAVRESTTTRRSIDKQRIGVAHMQSDSNHRF